MYIDGKIVYSGEWFEGVKEGSGEFFFENGYKYVGDWVDDVPHGLGQLCGKEDKSEKINWNYGSSDTSVKMILGKEIYIGEVRFALEGDSTIGFLVK